MDGLSELAAIGFPKTRGERVAWAGDRIWDYAEGSLSFNGLRTLEALVIGWCDVANEEERRQYLGLQRQIAALAREHEER